MINEPQDKCKDLLGSLNQYFGDLVGNLKIYNIVELYLEWFEYSSASVNKLH